jgi:hypothetical protein
MNFFKIHVLTIAVTLGITFYMLFGIAVFKAIPSIATLSFLAIAWVLMIKFNPVWLDLWEKWTRKD